MGFSLPGLNLFYLSRDNLEPERYELIIRPSEAWRYICDEYEFDDNYRGTWFIEGIRPKTMRHNPLQAPPGSANAEARLRRMVFSGDVVMLGRDSSAGAIFYIDNTGSLVCHSQRVFEFSGEERIIREYRRSVACRDYRRSGGKPRPTQFHRSYSVRPSQPVTELASGKPETFGTINSKMAGRLLAAGGIYNGNVESFQQTAEQLGGDAPAGYDQVMDNKCVIIAGVSVVAGFGLGRVGAVSEVSELKNLHVLGKVEGEYSLLKPGPLPNDMAQTFSGGVYKEISLSTDTIFYRGGVDGRPLGQFFGYEQPLGVLQTRVDKAVLPQWPNGGASPLNSYYEIQIPAGTKVYVGDVGYQTSLYSGGTEQVVVPTPWKIPGVKIIGNGGLK